MSGRPRFASLRDYVARLDDLDFWQPVVGDILDRHAGAAAGSAIEPGVGSTFPTFLFGNVALKLFGYLPQWARSFAAERAVQAVLATAPAILAPRLLGTGRLCNDAASPWPYLVTTRMAGRAWERAGLTASQKLAVAGALGSQIRHLHALRPAAVRAVADVATGDDWQGLDVTAAAARSSLPQHLLGEVQGFLASLGPDDPVLVHGDLMGRHVFVLDGRLAGIIDWGDALLTDRHYELAKLHLDLFAGDRALLRAFLEASDWPVTPDLPRRALGQALHRQAHGLTQHHSMDVFHRLPVLLDQRPIATLDELAAALFAV
ncbi:MAG: aminoglycoside phosphotransferase family protein [Geminicoccaceae bacterium]